MADPILSEAEILADALKRYTLQRKNYADLIRQEGYKHPDGSDVTEEDVLHALAMVERCEEMLSRANERVGSKIIRLH